MTRMLPSRPWCKEAAHLTAPKAIAKDAQTKVYKCPFEGRKCGIGKHCHALETPEALPHDFKAVIECKWQKTRIEVNLNPT